MKKLSLAVKPQRIIMVGTGYVGLVSGACLAAVGHHVVCVDRDVQKIERLLQGHMPIFEPGLAELVAENVTAGRLSFSTNLAETASQGGTAFIAVGTPTSADGKSADMRAVFGVAEELKKHLPANSVVVVKSTVPVGTNKKLQEIFAGSHNPCSNPEFLREGSAIGDFMNPDRVVVGVLNDAAAQTMQAIYAPFAEAGFAVQVTDPVSAEIIKYAANAFLATKITFINQMADLCEAVGADVANVAKGMGLDTRIGPKFLQAGPGYGGSCFPKDTKALCYTADDVGVNLSVVHAVIDANDVRKQKLIDKVLAACNGTVKDKKIAVLGVAFKAHTDDVRDSPALDLIPALVAAGAKVVAFDPEGRSQAEPQLPTIEWADAPMDAAQNADALVVVTEWPEFAALDLAVLKQTLKAPVVVDFRNLWAVSTMQQAGFKYVSVGRETV